jgi:hypothetical protein
MLFIMPNDPLNMRNIRKNDGSRDSRMSASLTAARRIRESLATATCAKSTASSCARSRVSTRPVVAHTTIALRRDGKAPQLSTGVSTTTADTSPGARPNATPAASTMLATLPCAALERRRRMGTAVNIHAWQNSGIVAPTTKPTTPPERPKVHASSPLTRSA